MRVRWCRKTRQTFWINNVLSVCVVVAKACQKLSWRLFALTSVCVLVLWWIRSRADLLCDGQAVQNQICMDYAAHSVSGDLCYELCYDKLFQLSGCGSVSLHGALQRFRVLQNGDYLPSTIALVSLVTPDLPEGLPTPKFKAMVSTYLSNQLNRDSGFGTLVSHLSKIFDFNKDDKLSYGEAQTMWKLLHQPTFLNNYLFQHTGAVPLLNGTCGPLSLWTHQAFWSQLFSKTSLWPLSLLFPKAFHMTLPSWPRRAKVAISLLELAEELMENFGASFHLCNISGESLFYNKHYDVVISDLSHLVSGQQVKMALANRTCHHDHDCILSPQCQAKCNFMTRKCSKQLTRTTVAYMCDLIKEYLVFDAPKPLRRSLLRHVRACQALWWSSSPDFPITHSVVVFDLKQMLWEHIQELRL